MDNTELQQIICRMVALLTTSRDYMVQVSALLDYHSVELDSTIQTDIDSFLISLIGKDLRPELPAAPAAPLADAAALDLREQRAWELFRQRLSLYPHFSEAINTETMADECFDMVDNFTDVADEQRENT